MEKHLLEKTTKHLDLTIMEISKLKNAVSVTFKYITLPFYYGVENVLQFICGKSTFH